MVMNFYTTGFNITEKDGNKYVPLSIIRGRKLSVEQVRFQPIFRPSKNGGAMIPIVIFKGEDFQFILKGEELMKTFLLLPDGTRVYVCEDEAREFLDGYEE